MYYIQTNNIFSDIIFRTKQTIFLIFNFQFFYRAQLYFFNEGWIDRIVQKGEAKIEK